MSLLLATLAHRPNSCGPASRTRRETVTASLLDDAPSPGHCRRLVTLGLRFPEGADPVDWVEEAMARSGHADVESLRESFVLPTEGLICAPAPEQARLPAEAIPIRLALEQALLLGLCNAAGYFPRRPVLWTRTALSRCLYLFEPGGFYQ